MYPGRERRHPASSSDHDRFTVHSRRQRLARVEYTITVTDTKTGQLKDYANTLGSFGSLGDTNALPLP